MTKTVNLVKESVVTVKKGKELTLILDRKMGDSHRNYDITDTFTKLLYFRCFKLKKKNVFSRTLPFLNVCSVSIVCFEVVS